MTGIRTTDEDAMRKLDLYIAKHGPEAGRALYHALQSQAGHASVSARLKRKFETLRASRDRAEPAHQADRFLPLFPEAPADEAPAELRSVADAAREGHASEAVG